ncbi:uncharacterized protein TNCV_3629491 [Trichonephila clavipes]|nr:uncharacterized protein TNCV_3629491 [Trichonephila clavipes]
MDAISRRYRKPKGRPSKEGVCVHPNPRDDDSNCFDANKKLVEAFLKIGKGHAALELFSMAIGIHAMDKKTFSKCLHKLYEEKCSFKEDILEISRK